MKHSFKATIYKVGINPCVDVPKTITGKLQPSKGYIPVKGKIKNHYFRQTLVPVKNAKYRLYVNGVMLKGSNTKTGENVRFTIEQDLDPREVPMPKELKHKLEDNHLYTDFKQLTSSGQKEILNYLNYMKSEEALMRNINKVIDRLKRKKNVS